MIKKTKFIEDLVEEVKQDFLTRQKERKQFEAIWQLNNNFFMGNQYSSINYLGEVQEYDKQFFWQEREVFNHIAPIIESRLSKLSTVRPKMNIMPTSSEEGDLKVAKLSRDILKSVYQKSSLNKAIIIATQWSEITGTSFYKVMWNSKKGHVICLDENKNNVYEGEVEVVALPPYEIFPDSNSSEDIENCSSIIHAKAYSTQQIKNIWGVDVEGRDINVFNLEHVSNMGGLGYKAGANKVISGIKHNHALVIERYESPTAEYPEGRLVIVCEDKLLYDGVLPYINKISNKRGFPFVRQTCISQPGCFWGTSVIERVIPIQRAYNAVKNRKHEYINRLCMGVLTVEDGSVDTENLEEEGLSPGKVLIYRQGSEPPKMMAGESLPLDFEREEEKLLQEFSEVGGVSNVFTSSTWSRNMSGTAMELLVEQESARLNITSDNIKNAIIEVSKQILKLYKQFAVTPRLLRVANSNGRVEVVYWKNSDVSCDQIEFSTENENGDSISTRRDQILKLVEAGLLTDSDGSMSPSLKTKILELFGIGVWEGNVDQTVLQKNYAENENLELLKGQTKVVKVLEIDNHEIHKDRHISFMLDKEYNCAKENNKEVEEIFLNHIREHKKLLKETTKTNQINQAN